MKGLPEVYQVVEQKKRRQKFDSVSQPSERTPERLLLVTCPNVGSFFAGVEAAGILIDAFAPARHDVLPMPSTES
jgi:hypothetical protein